ncbi:hypothetical protein B9W64_16860 [Streptomyces sp. CS159]|nr:hypothetical protein B9W64_16860 [Streptomyces sp. CS159]
MGSHLAAQRASPLDIPEECLPSHPVFLFAEPTNAFRGSLERLQAVIFPVYAPLFNQVGLVVHRTIGVLEFEGWNHDAAEVVDAALQEQVESKIAQTRHPGSSIELLG